MSNTENDQAKIISDLQFVEAVRKWRRSDDEVKIAELEAAIDSQQGVDLVLRGMIRELEQTVLELQAKLGAVNQECCEWKESCTAATVRFQRYMRWINAMLSVPTQEEL